MKRKICKGVSFMYGGQAHKITKVCKGYVCTNANQTWAIEAVEMIVQKQDYYK